MMRIAAIVLAISITGAAAASVEAHKGKLPEDALTLVRQPSVPSSSPAPTSAPAPRPQTVETAMAMMAPPIHRLQTDSS